MNVLILLNSSSVLICTEGHHFPGVLLTIQSSTH